MAITPYFLKPLLVAAWNEFVENAKPIIVKAAANCGIHPFNANAANFQGSAVSKAYDLVAADKAAAVTTTAEPAVERVEIASPLVLLKMKTATATSPATTDVVIRKAAADFFQTSWVMPATDIQRMLKEQKELKKSTMPLEVDRNAPPDTSVGLWVTSGVLDSLQKTDSRKVPLWNSNPK